MHSITAQLDFGPSNGGIIAYYFDSEATAKATLAQALSQGYLTVPAGAKTSAGRIENTEVHYPLQRVVSVS